MSQATSTVPIALQQGEGDARWFLGALCTIKSSADKTGGRVAVTENWAPRGHGSPLHVHHQEDEWFYVLSGELTFWVDGRVVTATEGSFVYGPRDVPHTFRSPRRKPASSSSSSPPASKTSSTSSPSPRNRSHSRRPPSSRPRWRR